MSQALPAEVLRIRAAGATRATDWLAVERPLEIRVRTTAGVRVVSTTMRTPGDDVALAAGFLFSERVIARPEQILTALAVEEDAVSFELDAAGVAALGSSERKFVTTGACGVCGRENLDALMAVPRVGGCEESGSADGPSGIAARAEGIADAIIHGLPAALRRGQATFAQTGGLHAAGLFDARGELQTLFEDVGRHNAVDKLVGSLLLAGRLPACGTILMVSGRASFELVQKAAVAGIPVMAAVGAPSSLAVEVARQAGMSLLGFVREQSFNVYCGAERLSATADRDGERRDGPSPPSRTLST